MGDSSVKLAVLIDADNAQSSAVGLLLAEVAKYGTASVKRAYGDWTTLGLKGWKDQLLRQSIQPMQQFAYTQGKNSTDSAMIIDAMDLLYTGKFDGFCIVSSDSDFTRLAARIRESGLVVYGFGERKTPEPFVASCDKFIYVENLAIGKSQPAASDGDGGAAAAGAGGVGFASPTRKVQTHNAPVPASIDSRVITQLRVVARDVADEDGWASLAKMGILITKRFPDFDSRNYGFFKLRELIVATNKFETTQRIPGEGKPPVVYARDNNYNATN
ncbi:NYN domain-containing protein [Apiospora kogelbergensis]|uniref:NYN domain-containing protein n=1 Tax=Apiospora kogelbergensis TaxID=1337665 RepID=A0AAW0QEF2_9PEZI